MNNNIYVIVVYDMNELFKKWYIRINTFLKVEKTRGHN